jgi:hypothetical protein
MEGLSRRARHNLLLDHDAEVALEVAAVKRVFAAHRVELKKIHKHYAATSISSPSLPAAASSDGGADEPKFATATTPSSGARDAEGIDFSSWCSFCRDCGFFSSGGGHGGSFGMGTGIVGARLSLDDARDVFRAATAATSSSSGSSSSKPKASQQKHKQGHNALMNAEDDAAAADAAAPEAAAAVLTPSLFLDAIIRVANLRYGPPPESIAGLDASSTDGEAAEAAAAAAAPPPIDSLAGRVSYAVERDILVGACRTVVDEFRASVASEAVRAVFRANKGKISALFRRYANMEDGESASNTDGARSGSDSTVKKQGTKHAGPSSHPDSHLSLSFAQFLSLLRDLGLVEGSNAVAMMAPPSWSRRASTGLTAATLNASGTAAATMMKLSEARLRTLFQNVQQEEEFAGSDGAGASHRTTAAAAPAVTGSSASASSSSSSSASSPLLRSINYVEWLESLASLSCWVLPDPFVPLATKLDAFLSDTVFGALRRH